MRVKTLLCSASVLCLTLALVQAPQAQAARSQGQAQVAITPRNTDFNGDGYNDLFIGSPSYPGWSGTQHRGLVAVVYGGPEGLGRSLVIRPPTNCVTTPKAPEPCTGWGKSLASTDVDRNGRPDLVFTGDRDLEIYSWSPLGVYRIYRHDTGISYNSGSHLLSAGQFDDDPAADVITSTGGWPSAFYGFFGWYNWRDGSMEQMGTSPQLPFPEGRPGSLVSSMDSADVDGDGKLETAIVVDGTWPPSRTFLLLMDDSQAVTVIASPDACGPPTLSSSDFCLRPDTEVAIGDVNGDSRLDIVAATPTTGRLQIWNGSPSGYPAFPSRVMSLPWLSPAPAGAPLKGRNLTVGDVNGDGMAEIAIGDPFAEISGQYFGGRVALIPGSSAGPALDRTQLITQDAVTFPNQPGPAPAPVDPVGTQTQGGDRFGETITILDVTGDGLGEVIIGVPDKHGGSGMLAVMRGTSTGALTQAQTVLNTDLRMGSPSAGLGTFIMR